MSETKLTVEIADIGLVPDEATYVDVKYQLKYDTGPPIASVNVRVFAKSRDLTIAEVQDEARRLSAWFLSQIAVLTEDPEMSPELRQRWR